MLNGADEQDMIDHIRSSQLGTARPATRGTAGIDPERRAPPSQDHRIHSSRAAPRVVCGANRRERLLTVEICECTASTHQDHGPWALEVLPQILVRGPFRVRVRSGTQAPHRH